MGMYPVINRGTWKGFAIIGTGGNCTALYRRVSSGRYYMITNLEGVLVPGERPRRVLLGLYDSETGDCLGYDEYTPAAAKAAIKTGEVPRG